MGSALLFAIVWINFFLVFLFFFLFDFCDKVSNILINVCYTSSIRKNYQGQDFFIVFFFLWSWDINFFKLDFQITRNKLGSVFSSTSIYHQLLLACDPMLPLERLFRYLTV